VTVRSRAKFSASFLCDAGLRAVAQEKQRLATEKKEI
jgi:hypothetical protein